CAICDLDGRLIAQAEHVPIHVGALPYAARAVTEFFTGEINPGDMFLLNDPYHGGDHLPAVTVFVPVVQGGTAPLSSLHRAAPPTAPTTRPPRKSGTRACASRRSKSPSAASCAAT